MKNGKPTVLRAVLALVLRTPAASLLEAARGQRISLPQFAGIGPWTQSALGPSALLAGRHGRYPGDKSQLGRDQK